MIGVAMDWPPADGIAPAMTVGHRASRLSGGGSVRAATGRRVRQVLLLCALALSVIGMHHVALGSHGTSHEVSHEVSHETGARAAMPVAMSVGTTAELPEVRSPGGQGSGAGHDLMHLCVAVLCATGGFLLLAWLLMAVSGGVSAPSADHRPSLWRVWRLPGTAGRSLLASVCVLRL